MTASEVSASTPLGVGAPSWSGAATTPAIFEQPLAAVALVGADRAVDRATALFLDCCGSAEAFLNAFEAQIESVLAGDADQATARLDRTTLDISAILDPDGTRGALLTITRPARGSSADGEIPLLDQAIDTSPAIVWVKDLEGRYLRVNGRYVEQMKVAAEHVCGKTDGELAVGQSIEGLRWREGEKAPLELEYTVDAAEQLPAFAVLRFALRDAHGKPVSVCGVAAPLTRASMARSEGARLIRLERWSRSDEPAVRAELIAEWGLRGVDEADEVLPDLDLHAPGPEPVVLEADADHFAAMAAELDAALETSSRLDRELAEERRQVMVLREASALAARRAHELLRTVTTERARLSELEEGLAQAQARVAELESERDAERSRAERAEAGTANAVAQEHKETEALRAELEAERAHTHEAKVATEKAQAELASATATLAREQRAVDGVRAELRAAEEEMERVRRAATEAVAQAPTHDELEEERRRADRATAALAAARAHSEMAEAEAKSALAQARGELRRVHEEAAAAAEALNAEKQRSNSVRGELTELQDELGRERARAEQVEAALEQARREASDLVARAAELEQAQQGKSTAAATADKRTAERLRGELAGVREELVRAKQAVAERPTPDELEQERIRAEEAEAVAVEARREAADLAERVAELEQAQKGKSTAATAADKRTTERLRRELASVREELARAKQAVAEGPTVEELEQERVRAEEAEAAAEHAEAAAEQARHEAAGLAEKIARLERGRRQAPKGASQPAVAEKTLERERLRAERAEAALDEERARADAECEAADALRAELNAARSELEALGTPLVAVETAVSDRRDAGSLVWTPAAQRALSAALGEATDWRGVLKQAVKVIGHEGGWDAAVAWCPDGRHGFMKCAAMWAGDDVSAGAFETHVWQHRQKLPSGTDESPERSSR